MIDHVAYGRHSNIPECCIKFFVEKWEPDYETKWRDTTYDKLVNKLQYNYVPCLRCLFTGKKSVIRQCLQECKKECWKDY